MPPFLPYKLPRLTVSRDTIIRCRLCEADGVEAFAWLREGAFDLLLIDLKLPGGMSGLEIAEGARAYQPDAAVLILTASSELADAVGDSSVHHFETMLKTASPQDVLDRVAALIAQQHGLHRQ